MRLLLACAAALWLGRSSGLLLPKAGPRAAVARAGRQVFSCAPQEQQEQSPSLPLAPAKVEPVDDPWKKYSVLLLNFVAVIWGSQHAVIKDSVASFGHPSLLIFWRFLLGCGLFLPALAALASDLSASSDEPSKKDANEELLRAGAELGLYTFLGFSFQAVGLETTTASRSAFLLYLNVKFVPVLAVLFLGRRFAGNVWLSAALALAGTFLLSTDSGPAVAGDVWCILAALASGAFILRLEAFSARFDAPRLNAVTFLTVLALAAVWVAADFAGSGMDLLNADVAYRELWQPLEARLPQVLYLGVVSTALCNYLQTLGQKHVPATKASIIYSLDPLYGAGFSYLLLGEQMGLQGFLGGLFILAGVGVSSMGNGEQRA